ncbi:MAG: hypothetical protein K2L59_03860 [Muribaculaceae bacterium]|nr:hypothetical protein [Muribaculaceae bacterium]
MACTGMVSCIDDAMTTSSSDVLSFSRDTVDFDTVFTDLGTPTARLIVFNRASKGLEISSIKFRDPDTKFRFNVDGVSGVEFHDVEIRGRDSIYVFIECFIPETQGASPGLVADDLEFVTNGVTQTVRVEAYGQNVTRLRNVRLTSDTRLTADRPYVVFDSLTVGKGVTLTVDPGAQLLFHDGASLVVEGRIEAVGQPGKMIDMRGDRLDNVLPDVKYDILPGQWKGVRIADGSYGNRIEYVDMRSTLTGLTVDSCADISQTRLTLLNSWLHNSSGNVLTSRYSKVNAYGCCFSEAGGSVVSLAGGDHEFLQCTIANNHLYSISGPLLELLHVLPEDIDENGAPLMRARFSNSIIYGLMADLNIGDLTGSDVMFRYVSLGSEGSDDDNFINCLWDTDPLFRTVRQDYVFNYRLQEDSPVRSAGDPALVTPEVMYDMDGADRLGYGAPSLGAYQYTPQ